MPATRFEKVIQHIHAMAAGRPIQELTDRQLLDTFLADRTEAAFAALVSRHGPMIFRICRRVLEHEQDAEDAFQAVLVVFARNGHSIRKREALAEWLHGVAYRTAMKAKRSAARRRNHEGAIKNRSTASASSPSWNDVQLVLDEEIQQLPKAYKAAFVLCVLQGKSGPQAARELDIPVGTVSSRLTWARKRLQQRLSRRGIELSAILAALSVAEGVGRAMPANLTSAKLLAGLISTASGTTTDIISPHVVALAQSVGRAMFVTKAKIGTGLLLAVGILATGGAMARQAVGDRPAPQVAQAPSTSAMATKSYGKSQPIKAIANDLLESATYGGQVVDENGKPVTGAKVYYHFCSGEYEPHPVRASTDAQGRFAFTLSRNDVPDSALAEDSDPLKLGHIIVKADGFAYAWRSFAGAPRGRGKSDLNPIYRVARDNAPVEGRLVNLEGKPLPNLRISVLSAAASDHADLADFIKAIGDHTPLHEALLRQVSNNLVNIRTGSTMAQFLPSATTDKEGHFSLRGFGKEQVLELRIEGEPVETQTVFVMTRPRPVDSPSFLTPLRLKEQFAMENERSLLLWNGFNHALPPGRVIVGTVRDEKTGAPIPRAIVESYQLAGSTLGENAVYHTVADENGKYRFAGLPRGKGSRIRIRPTSDLPYLPIVKEVQVGGTLEEVTVDASLERGIWADVATSDKSSGKAISGSISYFFLPEDWAKNPTLAPPVDRHTFAYNHFMRIRPDGTFRFVAVPGRAIVAFRADSKMYPMPANASTIKLPSHLSPSNFVAFAEINPRLGDPSIRVEFVLDAGRIFQGKLLDPDGRPLTGVVATDLRGDGTGPDWPALRTADFTVVGLEPGRPRLICFIHLEKKLAGSLIVRDDADSARVVKLQPWATVSGRLLDSKGDPIKNSSLEFTEIPKRRTGQPSPLDVGIYIREPISGPPTDLVSTDDEGRFFAARLIPGLKYSLALDTRPGAKEAGFAFTNLVFKPGESRTLGDVTLQPTPEE
jgi:RNA polymerase sigma factor (sigma-70 family)